MGYPEIKALFSERLSFVHNMERQVRRRPPP